MYAKERLLVRSEEIEEVSEESLFESKTDVEEVKKPLEDRDALGRIA